MVGYRDFRLGRLMIAAVQTPITEQLGSQVANIGEATAVGQRRAKGFTLTLQVHGTPGDPDLQVAGNRMRRQLRSLIQNHPYRLAGLYAMFTYDSERNGWLVIGESELADDNGGVPFAEYKLTISQAFKVGDLSTHREALRVALTDRRLTTSPVDTLGQQINTTADFAAMSALALTFLPVGATDAECLGRPVASGQRQGSDGTCVICAGRSDGDPVSWSRTEADMGKGDVVVYDRRGQLTAPASAPDSAWEEVYGPDYPWSWQTGTPDTPMLANSLCRVRWDSSSTPGWRVDAWSGGQWTEQGKLCCQRRDAGGAGTSALDTLVAAELMSYTPERAVVSATLRASGDPASREQVMLTLQRGWTGPRLEVYAAPSASGGYGSVGAAVSFTVAQADTANSVVALDAGAAALSSSIDGLGVVGASSFTGENWLNIARQGQPLAATLAVVQAAASKTAASSTGAYGSARPSATVALTSGGYVSARVSFTAQSSDQVLEAESVRYASSPTTSQVADAAASGGQAVRDTQAAATNQTLLKLATGLRQAKYRVLARVRVDSGATGSFIAATSPGSATGVATTTATGWTWVDLGETLPTAASCAIGLTAWRSAGSGNVYVDRVELVKVEDRTAAAPSYDGARDHGASLLFDSRGQPRLVARGG